MTDRASVELLIGALSSAQERQILYALGLLESARGVDFSERLLPLLRHRSPHVREAAVRALAALPQPQRAAAEALLEDPAPAVRAAAVEYLCSADAGSPVDNRSVQACEGTKGRSIQGRPVCTRRTGRAETTTSCASPSAATSATCSVTRPS